MITLKCFLPILLLGCILSFTCSGQPYYFKHYLADDGLAHNTVLTVMQDSKGLMWIGSRGGLNCFDGNTFKTFKDRKNDFGNIGNNIITAIAEDKNGMLWVGTGEGIFRYDPYIDTFSQLADAPAANITNILVDTQNNLWFLDGGKLFSYQQKWNKLVDLKMNALCLAFDHSMKLWMGNQNGSIRVYDPIQKKITDINIIGDDIPAKMRAIDKILPTQGDEVLVGFTKQGLKSYNTKTGIIKSLLLRNADKTEIFVRDIVAGNNRNEYWIATESGIYIYDLGLNTSRNLRKRADDPYSISDNAVYSIFRDKDGGMWAGTFFGGLNYYSKRNAQFEKYYPLLDSNSISGNAVREICADKEGNLWIGTEDAGVNKFDIKTGKFTRYTANGKLNGLSYPNIHGLLAVGDQLFVGPFLHGLEIMDMHSGLIKDRFKLIGEGNQKTSEFVMSIFLTREGTLLIGTADGAGLFVYNKKAKTFTAVKQVSYTSGAFVITEDDEGNIWTGSNAEGAFFYNPKTGEHGNLRFGKKGKTKIVKEFAVYGILEDSNHAIWFTTEGDGLVRLDPDRKTIKKFTTKNGLPTNLLFRALEDNSGHLWISSFKGLICFDLHTEKFKVYTQANGLITDQFNYNSAFKDIHGKMYFGSVKGMIAFNPADFKHTDPSPPTYITGFQIDNKEITPKIDSSPLKKAILYTDTIVLKYDQNNFSVEFAAINYASPKVTRYKYLMKGLDKHWTYLNTNRSAYFTNLSAGEYTFIVNAESNVGSWTGKERRLFIKVLPPIWKSNAAYFVYLLIAAIALYLFNYYYHLYLEKKNANKLRLFEHEKEKEVYQSKIEFFTNIAHEIHTPLTLIIGPLEWVIETVKGSPAIMRNLLLINKHAQRLSALTDQLLDFRQTETDQYGLSYVNTNISTVVEEQLQIFRHEAQKQKIVLSAVIPKKAVVAYVDKEAFVKICTNLLSNAVKYCAGTARVEVDEIDKNSHSFTIRFYNDGKRIPAHARELIFEPFYRLKNTQVQGTGIGLALARSLTELHGGKLILLNDTDLTVFQLSLPIHQKFEFKLDTAKKSK